MVYRKVMHFEQRVERRLIGVFTECVILHGASIPEGKAIRHRLFSFYWIKQVSLFFNEHLIIHWFHRITCDIIKWMGNLQHYFSKKLATNLIVGEKYTIYDLALLLEVKPAYFTLKGGVVSRSNQDVCLIMISLQKKKKTNPYTDKVVGNSLLWDSPENDDVYLSYIERGYTFNVFIHDDNKKPYTYYGRAYPINWQPKQDGIPAKVSFLLYDFQQRVLGNVIIDEIPNEIIMRDCVSEQKPDYSFSNLQTTRNRVVKTRTVQYKFRSDTMDLWNHQCAISGVSEERVLIASHIKPWCSSSDIERIDPHNGLILNPTYDKLFDLGFISFTPDNGRILLSEQIDPMTWDNLKITGQEKLSKIPLGTESFLDYHNNCVFNLTSGKSIVESLVV